MTVKKWKKKKKNSESWFNFDEENKRYSYWIWQDVWTCGNRPQREYKSRGSQTAWNICSRRWITIYMVPKCLVGWHHWPLSDCHLHYFLFFQQWQISPPFFLLTIWENSTSLTGHSHTFHCLLLQSILTKSMKWALTVWFKFCAGLCWLPWQDAELWRGFQTQRIQSTTLRDQLQVDFSSLKALPSLPLLLGTFYLSLLTIIISLLLFNLGINNQSIVL